MLGLPLDGEPDDALLGDELAAASGPKSIVLAIAYALPALAARLAAGQIPGEAAALQPMLSEEEIEHFNADADWDVAIDPMDSPGNIGTCAPLGVSFSILPASAEGFLPARRAVVWAKPVAAGATLRLRACR